jgi:hypothetical protein
MTFIRKHLLTAAATIGVFAIAGPVWSASASNFPVNSPSDSTVGGQIGSYGCAVNTPAGVGTAGGTTNEVCGSGGLIFIGPSIGQISTVVGPTIIGSTVLAPVTVSSGPVRN